MARRRNRQGQGKARAWSRCTYYGHTQDSYTIRLRTSPSLYHIGILVSAIVQFEIQKSAGIFRPSSFVLHLPTPILYVASRLVLLRPRRKLLNIAWSRNDCFGTAEVDDDRPCKFIPALYRPPAFLSRPTDSIHHPPTHLFLSGWNAPLSSDPTK